MKLFLKRKASYSTSQPTIFSKGLQAAYNRVQGGWVNWMRKRTEKFSRRTWIALVIVFVVSIGTYDAYLITSSITTKGHGSFFITPIQMPEHVTATGETGRVATGIADFEYNRIKRFRMYMDSLARSPSDKTQYDSITRQYPGLMDSLRFIENYYKQLKLK